MHFGVDYLYFTKFYNDTIQLLHKMCLRPEGPVDPDIVLQALRKNKIRHLRGVRQ